MAYLRRRSKDSERRLPLRALIVGIVLILAPVAGVLYYVKTDSGPDSYVERARHFQAQGEPNAAIIELKNALQKDPDNPETRWLLGGVYLSMGDGAAAQKEIERAWDQGLTEPEVRIALLRSLLLQQKYTQVLGQLIDADPTADETTLLVLRGRAHFGLRDVDKAHGAFSRALELNPDNAEAHRGLARTALLQRENAQAAKHIEQALQTPDEGQETLLLKGEVEFARGDFEQASETFQKVIDDSPKNSVARIGLVRVLLAQDQPDAALEHIEHLGANKDSKDPVVNYLRALVARQKNELDEAQRALREVLSVAPTHAPSLLLLGSIHYAKRELEQAEALLIRYLGMSPGNMAAIKMLSAVHLRNRAADAALARLLPAVEQTAQDAQLLALVGSAYIAKGDFQQATDYFEQAAALQPDSGIRTQLAISHIASGDTDKGVSELRSVVELDPEFARADYLLALIYLRQGKFDEALATAERLAEGPSAPIALNLMGAAYEGKGMPDKARGEYQRALSINSDYQTPALNVARLDFLQGDVEAAKSQYEAVLDADPDNGSALGALAQIALKQGRTADAVKLLERSRRSHPKMVDARLLLAEHYLKSGKVSEALSVASEAYEIAPQHPSTLLVLGQAHLVSQNYAGAASMFDELLSQNPQLARARYYQGVARARLGDIEGARSSLQQALELEPELLDAKANLGALALAVGDVETALEIALELQTDDPSRVDGYVLHGDALMQQGSPALAREAYEKALAISPQSATVIKAAVARRTMGSADDAYRFLHKWTDQHPADAAVRLALAGAYHSAGETANAAKQYEQVLEANPDSVLALNNLAWIYYDSQNERALDLAKRAYEQAPDRGEIADTYGWLLVEAGQLEQGLALLEKAVTQVPDNLDIRYHWAASLARSGDSTEAHRELKQLLQNDAAFREREAAETLLEQMLGTSGELFEVEQPVATKVEKPVADATATPEPVAETPVTSDATPAPKLEQTQKADAAEREAPAGTGLRVASAAPAGTFLIQLGAFRNAAAAVSAWERIRTAQPALFQSHTEFVRTVDLGVDKGLWHRLQVGPLNTKAGAEHLCDELKRAEPRSTCFVVEAN